MWIYFSAPIRSSRERAPDYFKMIELLNSYGGVLTEHIGDTKTIPTKDTGLNEAQLYERDMEWLRKANVVVADVSIPSLGVGYELAVAEALGKEVLCLYMKQNNARLSAMIKGNPKFKLVEYHDMDEASKGIKEFFEQGANKNGN
ncbi:MAG: nucleoside 2-deoxyribosyltransferase [Candidatus Micrarchaeales archaeon]